MCVFRDELVDNDSTNFYLVYASIEMHNEMIKVKAYRIYWLFELI